MSVLPVSNVTDSNLNTEQTSTVSTASENFSSYLNTTPTLEEIFKEASETYGVDVNLLKAIAKQESDFDSSSTSSCGAMGIMQLMPSTAASLGVTDAYDARQNIMGGAQYISGLLAKYDNNVPLALAAYNAGSGNVAKYGGIPPFEETQNYVVKVMGYYTDGVSIPTDANASVTSTASYADTTSATSTDSYESDIVSLAEDIFNYDDYLQFLELYLTLSSEEKDQQTQELQDQSALASSTDDYYAYQSIKYNKSILNLFKN